MNEPVTEADIATAETYETLFVPALFQQWAPRVVRAAQLEPGHRVLDIACGTGILAREALIHVAPFGRVCGLDMAPGMLEVAKRLAPALDWRQGQADALPFSDQTFDRVVSQFGLMLFPDPSKALQEIIRVLNPNGRFAVAVWDALEQMPAYAEEVALLERCAGQQAADALRAPFALGKQDQLKDLAFRVGITTAECSTMQGTARFPSVRSLVEADVRGWLPLMGVKLDEQLIQTILEEAEKTLQPYVNDQGQAVFQVSAHILSGSKS